ncbi:histidine ammonia-lyase [Pilimelia anulata]|uniref:Histidine ammonia-lyase n=1 Tax=Pilimelia anulata TaxID=53371 RepID=A0A8J3BFG1_9ACTN|nr:aromatic amino acid ammonia-lyase [Pilimelia anulata]GGK05196.1 histidine ammonia-lyase [Pilimelia anulata]
MGRPARAGAALGLTVALAAGVLSGSAPRPAPAAAAPGAAEVVLTGDALTLDDLFALLDADTVAVRLAPSAARRMTRARAGALAALGGGQRVYGWNQALGPLKDQPLSDADQRAFQQHILRSHAAGVGPALPAPVARLALVLRANAMARATMGVRPAVVQRLLSLVNAGVTPRMPEIGSLGTGDLQPMAAAGLVAAGEPAPAAFDGREGPARRVLAAAGLPTSFTFESGEVLPLISGGSVLLARYVHALRRLRDLSEQFDGAFALFLEATRAEAGSLDARTHAERRIPAEEDAAARLRALVRGSEWMTDAGRHRLGEEHPRVQDAVSVRAAPHIVGTLRQTLAEARTLVEREANASTSNPLVLPRGSRGYEFVMGGNWDAAQLGHAIDTVNAQAADLGILAHELGGRLLAEKWSYGLPANLAGGRVGLNSGLVQAQTVATALIPEMQVRAVPAGVLSRPVKFGQEDHNTMAMASVRHLHENLDRLEVVLAVQWLLGAQGVDAIRERMGPLALGAGSAAAHAAVRRHVPALAEDRYLTPDVEEMVALVRGPELLAAVRTANPAYPMRAA